MNAKLDRMRRDLKSIPLLFDLWILTADFLMGFYFELFPFYIVNGQVKQNKPAV